MFGTKGAFYLTAVILASAAMPLRAADTSLWQGGASGIWGAGYEGNWNVYPDSTRYAQFDSPYDTPITVTVDESVDTYGVVNASGRTAGINFTGSGTGRGFPPRSSRLIRTAATTSGRTGTTGSTTDSSTSFCR